MRIDIVERQIRRLDRRDVIRDRFGRPPARRCAADRDTGLRSAAAMASIRYEADDIQARIANLEQRRPLCRRATAIAADGYG